MTASPHTDAEETKAHLEIQTCIHCRFHEFRWDEVADLEYLECRRYAPRMFSGSGEGWSNQLFPHMKNSDWCGEFQKP